MLRSGPVVLCEVAAENASRVGSILNERGYRFYDATVPANHRAQLSAPPYELLAIR